MTRSNAGLRRNRMPVGVTADAREVALTPQAAAAYDRAARASGDLSMSLYLELMFKQFEEQFGSLPVIGTAPLRFPEVADPAA